MANARIVYNFDTWQAATVTESSEITGRASSNLLADAPGKSWVTTGDTSEWVVFDLGSAVAITCVYINQHNFTSAATVTLEANTADSWGSPAYSQALTVATDADGVVLPSICFFLSETYRYWRLTVADAANPDGRIEIGNILGGQYYEFTRNWTDGGRVIWADPTVKKESPGAVELVKAYPAAQRYRQAVISFTQVGDTERQKWEAIFRKVGNTAPLVLALDPTDNPTTMSLFGYLMSEVGLAWQMVDYFDVATLTFEEKTR